MHFRKKSEKKTKKVGYFFWTFPKKSEKKTKKKVDFRAGRFRLCPAPVWSLGVPKMEHFSQKSRKKCRNFRKKFLVLPSTLFSGAKTPIKSLSAWEPGTRKVRFREKEASHVAEVHEIPGSARTEALRPAEISLFFTFFVDL